MRKLTNKMWYKNCPQQWGQFFIWKVFEKPGGARS